MLFTLPKVQVKKVLDEYAKRAPAPLNSQFPDRRGKEEAVQAYKVRKQKKMKTPLYPPGKFGVNPSLSSGLLYYLFYHIKSGNGEYDQVKCCLKELCHETAHARELRVNLKRLAQLFQVSRGDRHSEFIASNLGHPRIFFALSGFVT